ncbi:MAG: hypothetical protein AUK47_23815 [Deltaproteobacteria bacterium CG2_30_63_29]|nr:MAG: hypothetical protein AUK47_23815 [Deltaproteobacteria bacterium CG2_30_63_29]PJB47892.1 MAG: hypothetical protein CO108_03350 [Deltaproteobacteria bacterium CG_4_9_14_3_um_filter_63_12]
MVSSDECSDGVLAEKASSRTQNTGAGQQVEYRPGRRVAQTRTEPPRRGSRFVVWMGPEPPELETFVTVQGGRRPHLQIDEKTQEGRVARRFLGHYKKIPCALADFASLR